MTAQQSRNFAAGNQKEKKNEYNKQQHRKLHSRESRS